MNVVLAVIGDKWLSGGASIPTNKLQTHDDDVRWELSTAISSHRFITLVLIDGAEMPDEDIRI